MQKALRLILTHNTLNILKSLIVKVKKQNTYTVKRYPTSTSENLEQTLHEFTHLHFLYPLYSFW